MLLLLPPPLLLSPPNVTGCSPTCLRRTGPAFLRLSSPPSVLRPAHPGRTSVSRTRYGHSIRFFILRSHLRSPIYCPPSVCSMDTAWANGLRGIAALFVASSHITLCFARSTVPPSLAYDGPVKLFQRPILRLISQGNSWVAVFFVLLGFVNALKPIQLARADKSADALAGLARAAFRRTGRLFFPAASVTVLAWAACQLGLMDMARQSNAFWLQDTTPLPSPSWSAAVVDLFRELGRTWLVGRNIYDDPQWALMYLLFGSMLVYVVMLATVHASGAFRLTALGLLYVAAWIADVTYLQFNVIAGMFLAELSHTRWATAKPSPLRIILTYAAVVLGLVLASFPDQFAEQVPWSRRLLLAGFHIFPTSAIQGRMWPGVGAQVLCGAVLLNPRLRAVLSVRPLLWLGSISFPIYLLHGTLIRTLLTWLTFGPIALFTRPPSLEQLAAEGKQPLVPIGKYGALDRPIIPQPPTPAFVLILPLFTACVLAIAHAWNKHVEPCFGTLTVRCERFAVGWRRPPTVKAQADEEAATNGTTVVMNGFSVNSNQDPVFMNGTPALANGTRPIMTNGYGHASKKKVNGLLPVTKLG